MTLIIPSWAAAQEAPLEPDDPPGPIIDLPGQDPATQRIERATPTTLGGYGEIVFISLEDGDNEIDFHRFVLFVAHRFNDWISFYSEVEVEHAHEVEMEQARLDFQVHETLTVVAGLVLVPVGVLNIYHEPPLFHGANRPRVDRVIIPTTWREAGLGVIYRPLEGLTIEAYALSALNATGFTSTDGIRGGRQAVSEAVANDVAGALRVTVEPLLGLAFGVSGYFGGADQDQLEDESVTVAIAEADAVYRNFGLEARAEVALVFIDGADVLSAPGLEVIPEQLLGYYLELGYNVLETLDTEHALLPFVRYEAFDTHAAVPEGLTESAALDRTDVTFGLSYRPIPTLVFKADYQLTEAQEGDVPDQWDLGLGWMF